MTLHRAAIGLSAAALVLGCSLFHAGPFGEQERDGGAAPGASAADGGPASAADAGPADAAPAPPPEPATAARAVELVKAGDHEAALGVLDRLPEAERDTARLRYLHGRLLERLERPAEAAAALAIDAAELPEAVARDAELRRATLLVRSGRCAEAGPLIEALGRGARAPRVQALAAECALAQRDFAAAVKELTGVVGRGGGAGVNLAATRLKLAEAQAGAGDADAAKATLRALVLDSPERAEARRAAARLRELGGDPEALTDAERLDRAERLLDRRRYDDAVRELGAIAGPLPPGLLGRRLHLEGMALFQRRGRYEEAAKVLSAAAEVGGATAVDDEFHAARALSRADHDDEAIAAYRKLVKAHPDHARAAEAEYLAAWLELHHGRANGERRMSAFLKGPRAERSDSLRREALWQLGLWAYEHRRLARAADLFDQYAQTGTTGLVRGRGLYWKARSLEAAKRTGPAVASYREALAVEPLHWYALLARQRLEALGETAGPPFPEPAAEAAQPEPLPPPTLPPDVAFYAGVGLEDDALAAMQAQEAAIKAAAPRGRGLEALLAAYGLLGGGRRAYRLVSDDASALAAPPRSGDRWAWDAAYPRPHLEIVRAEAAKRGLDPAHLYATMRQESGYWERAVSQADAVGLLQVLPSTAQRHAEAMGVAFDRELLFEPRWNIALGAAEIAEHHEAFGRCLPLTIAAYNAGSARVREWLTDSGETDLDLFVEHIPFDETRNYVRRVISHLARYRYLEDPSQPWPLELPEKVGPN